MSPDPPRDNTPGEDLTSNSGVYFMPLPEDDDWMADEDAVHQLDYNTQDDSDFSDDEDHERQPREQETHNPESNNSTEPVTRMMAHYQLLIPFPPSEIVESSEASQSEGAVSGPELESPAIKSSPNEEASSAEEIAAANKKAAEEEEAKREIHLSQDNVELIKNVMKGFSLPPSAIPTWAEEIDEASWKDRLVSTMERKSSGPHSHSSHPKPAEAPSHNKQ